MRALMAARAGWQPARLEAMHVRVDGSLRSLEMVLQ
jgi:hypothetical protein